MTIGRNRLESHDSNSATAFFDTLPVEMFGHRRDAHGIEPFITEFRPVLGNFAAEFLLYDNDIETVLEDSISEFRISNQTRSWHKTVNYRCVVGKILIEKMLKHESCRRIQRRDSNGVRHVIDLGAANIVKQLSIAWRKHVVDESWQRLRQKELQSGRPYFSVLKRRYEKPWMSNGRLLHDLMDVFKTMPSKQSFRVFLFRCEQRFARNIVTTVAETFHMPNSSVVFQEMEALDLAHFWERLASTPAPTGSVQI